jgi:hypothetical protein
LATSTPFLDILIRCSLRNNHKLETLHYSKFNGKEYAKLHRPLYPARHFNIAIGQKQGVIKGRLTSLSRHVSVRHNFVQQAGILATIFENKHYDISTIRTLIQRWIHSKRGLLYGTSPQHLTHSSHTNFNHNKTNGRANDAERDEGNIYCWRAN